MPEERERRLGGRPRTKDTRHKDFTLSRTSIQYLEKRKTQDSKFNMSEFVDEAIKEKIEREPRAD